MLSIVYLELARELEFDEEQVNQIRIKNPNSLQDQSHALIRLWRNREGANATGRIVNHISKSNNSATLEPSGSTFFLTNQNLDFDKLHLFHNKKNPQKYVLKNIIKR